jgi:hypothetical protein
MYVLGGINPAYNFWYKTGDRIAQIADKLVNIPNTTQWDVEE